MKAKLITAAAMVALAIAATSCADDYAYNLGEGRVAVKATLNSDVKVVSRSDADELREKYGESLTLWLTKPGEGPIRQYQGIDNLPSESITLPSGNYVAEAWAGDSVSASWDARYFKANTPFDVLTGQTTPVDVVLTIANSLVEVEYDSNADDVIKDYTMTVGHSRGTLVFEGKDTRTASYMMPSSDKNLTLDLAATTLDGKPYTQHAVITDAKPGYLYKVKVTYKGTADAIGGAWFDITVDATEIVVEDQIVISLAPDIKGVNFDASVPVAAAPGQVGRRSIYISATETLTGVVLESADLQGIIGAEDLDLIQGAQSYITALRNAGITLQTFKNEAGDITNMRVNFEEAFTNKLAKGTHNFTFTAYDGALSTQSTLTFEISEAPLITGEPTGISYSTATLKAAVANADKLGANAGFKFRELTSSTWTDIKGTISGDVMTATVNNLTPGHTYEYAAWDGNSFIGTSTTFTTPAPNVVNAGFEDWNTSSKAYLIGPYNDNMFWDSGNHGSATIGKNVTSPDGSVKHSGNYSVKLASQFVGVGSMGKFAAGNIFVGKYLDTQGTNGVLGWGRQFDNTYTPVGLKGWVRYDPVSVTHSSTDKCPKGSMDTGIIYFALVTNDMMTYNGEQWPCVVNTKTQEFFNPTGSNVVKYGEVVFTEKTNGMVAFNLTLKDVNPSKQWTHIILVASASRYGDYFSGGNGSTMWIDDLQLVY